MNRERVILNIAYAKGMKFDVGHVIGSSIIEAANEKCTRGLIHPSTITMLGKIVGVQFLESEERCLSMLPLPSLKVKKAPPNSCLVIESDERENEAGDEQEEECEGKEEDE